MQMDHDSIAIDLPAGKKVYFASDFHLGAPNEASSKIREAKIIRWLNKIQEDAAAIFLVGDIFDFWFEYKYTIPKSFTRFLGKLAELKDSGIPIHFFTGNHDMWMFDYFPQELGIPIHRNPIELKAGNTTLHVGHGDGLGPGDSFYKFLKSVFLNKFFQWVFRWVHPNIGFWIATSWSRHSRLSNEGMEETPKGEQEWIYQYCKEVETKKHHDYYVFGHRHLPMQMQVGNKAQYYNLGEWVNHCTYLVFDGNEAHLERYSG